MGEKIWAEIGGKWAEIGGKWAELPGLRFYNFFQNTKHHFCGRDFMVLGPTAFVKLLFILSVLAVFGLSVGIDARATQSGVVLPNPPAGPQPC